MKNSMKKNSSITKLAVASLLCSVAVVGSLFSFPIFGSKAAPVQHMVNVLAAVLLGPGYAVLTAFAASLIRNLLGLGSLLAFPGSMIGALFAGLCYRANRKLIWALIGEVLGTGILGGLSAYPIAIAFMGIPSSSLTFYVYVIPFLISTGVGAIVAGLLLVMLERSQVLGTMQNKMSAAR